MPLTTLEFGVTARAVWGVHPAWFWHSLLEKPSSGFFPHLSCFGANFAQPGRLTSWRGLSACAPVLVSWGRSYCRLDTTLCTDSLVAISTEEVFLPGEKAKVLAAQNAISFSVSCSVVSHVLQSLHELLKSLFLCPLHLFSPSNHLDNHLLFRGVERFWLFPLVDCRRLDRPTRMKLCSEGELSVVGTHPGIA